MKEIIHGIEFEVIKIDPGPHVNCDLCNEEYMDSDAKGGFLFGSNAVCPKCAPKFMEGVKKHGEEHYIRAEPHSNESFRDFVYRIREEQEGDQNSSTD